MEHNTALTMAILSALAGIVTILIGIILNGFSKRQDGFSVSLEKLRVEMNAITSNYLAKFAAVLQNQAEVKVELIKEQAKIKEELIKEQTTVKDELIKDNRDTKDELLAAITKVELAVVKHTSKEE